LIIITIFVNFITLIFFYFLSISNIIPSISQIKFPLVFLLLALNVFVVTKIDIKKIYKIFFIIPILVIFYLEIIKGSYAFPFIILIFCYVLYFLLTKKIMFLPIFFSIIIFIILHSYKYEYRIATWYNNHQSNNLIYKSSSLVNAFKNYSDKFFNINSKKKLYSFTNRNVYRIFHSTESLIIVSKLTPDEVPHWKGESYKILSSKIIPRIFWKNKPSDTLGNQYGQRYKILFDGSKVIQDPFGSNIVLENALEMDKGTSWNMPTLNEFYVNFGIFGVIIGMFILGALYRLFAVLLSTRNHDNYEFIIGFATIFPLFFLESHLSILFGAVLQTLIFLILFILSSKVSINLIEKFVFNEKKNN